MTTLSIPQPKILTQLRGFWGSSKEPEIPDLYSYKLRDPLLSPAETTLYQVLLAVVGKRVVVCPKVHLADVFQVRAPSDQYKAFYSRIAQRRVDFLLCERYTLKPLLAVELYDHSQPRVFRKKRDAFIDKVFKAGKLPILHLVAQERYSPKALSVLVAPYMTMVVYARGAEQVNTAVPPRCPCCGVPMVKRKVISGDYQGKEYFSCRNYPNCCERLPLSKAHAYVN